jgi:hypothetical protein
MGQMPVGSKDLLDLFLESFKGKGDAQRTGRFKINRKKSEGK